MMDPQGVTRRSFMRAAGAAVGSGAPLIGDDGMAATTLNFARVLSTTLSVNGRSMSISHEARVSLLDLLRERLQLTGTKKGCNEGACGACTVLVDRTAGERMHDAGGVLRGRRAHDDEGLTGPDGVLQAVQQAFIDQDAFQCGYNTPGQIVRPSRACKKGNALDGRDRRMDERQSVPLRGLSADRAAVQQAARTTKG